MSLKETSRNQLLLLPRAAAASAAARTATIQCKPTAHGGLLSVSPVVQSLPTTLDNVHERNQAKRNRNQAQSSRSCERRRTNKQKAPTCS
jgi:hypothetical protein